MKYLFTFLFVIGLIQSSIGQNPIVVENALAGNPKTEWDISGAGDLSIQGFATDISVNKGGTIRFKIDVDPVTTYTIRIYRLGYYQGNGARLIINLGTFNGVAQPTPATNSTTGLVDCSNWSESANWVVPSTAVSGLYIAKLTRTNNSGSSHIPFIVRDDQGNAPILFKTSDATWQAYNVYGGNSLYTGATSYPNGHAVKVSYNRPFITRNGGGGGGAMEDWFMNAEYPMIRWIERNGYNVSYTTDIDMDRRATNITPAMHKMLISCGHDEYWSAAERTRFETARDAGVHLAFFSGNEVYWKTRWEDNHRTLVCYKEGTLGENVCGNKCDPTNIWTGLWRDGAAYDAGKPENLLTGQISWSDVTSAIKVPGAYRNLRFWRGTSVASQASTGTVTFPTGTLGYEWDFVQYPESYPNGYIALSSTTVSGKTHRLSLYRAPSGALVFGAGTVQWSWGLDNIHDRGSTAASVPMQQATVNLFADMGVQPGSIQSGLSLATASTDVTAPVVNITAPANGATLTINSPVTITGTASDVGGELVGVQVSIDGGTTWQNATGTSSWTFSWTPTLPGAATIKVRGYDDTGNMGVPGASGSPSNINVTISGSSPGCPCTIWPSTATPATFDSDGQGVEVGVKFRSSQNGYITGLRFYKAAGNTGTHIGHLWSSAGAQLAEATFINETASGWQQVLFTSPVQITANTTYVASYFSPNGFYSSTNPYFTTATVNGYLRALANGEDGGNGVYVYSSTPAFPGNMWQSANYWVDVVFNTSVAPDVTAPTINLTAPAAGTVSGTINVSANAADNTGVVGVQFLLNGPSLGSEDLSSPYSVSWNTGSVANGSYTLTAVARDAAGNTTTSSAVVVNVNNVPDTQAPVISITAPAGGTVANIVNITANATDNVGVAGVQFFLNGTNLGAEDVSAPFSYSWNSFTVANGTYTLTARARDAAGNSTTSAAVVVTVANSSNLIAAYSMNEGSGTAASDISGNSHHAVLMNAPTWTTGKYGQGVNLDGTNDYINIADHNNFSLNPAESYTWSGWLKNNNFTEWSTVWSQTLDGNNFFYFYSHTTTDPDGGPVTNGLSVYWWANGGTNKLGAHSNNNVLTAGQWSYVTVTYDGTQPQNNRFSIYVNGVDVTNRSDVSSTGTLPAINPTNIRIGSNQPFGEYLNGAVDEFRFYRRQLSLAEIQADMNTSLAPDLTSPAVNITAPAAGNVIGTINVTANATDNVAVTGVQFLLNGANLGAEDLASPYTVSWNTTTVANGNYTLTVRARDAAGNNTTSAPVVVTVNNAIDVTAPTVTLTAPAAGQVTGSVNVAANAADNVGVVGVQFLLNGVNLGSEDLSAPYTVSWNTLLSTNGNYTLTARARDAAGNSTVSAGVLVTVDNDLTAPVVSITDPTAGEVLGVVSISATATDNVGVTGVQFKLNGVNLGTEDLSAPFTTSWNTLAVANGNYTLTAVARDAAGNSTTSASVAVTVNNPPDTQAPAVTITAPAAGNVTLTVNVTANATDNVGVVGVQFFLNGINIGSEDLSAPFSASWNTLTVPNGVYTLTSSARDAAGNTTTSAPVIVTVNNNTNLIASLNFNEGTGTLAADNSGNSHNGTLTNAPTWGTGKYGQGVNLDGTNDYVNIADHNNFTLDPAQSYTWSAWIRNNNFNEWSTVWSQTVNSSNFFYFYAHTSTDVDGGPVTNGISAYWWNNDGGSKIGVHSNNNVLTAGQWSHVTVTYNASQPQNNRFTIYVNGTDVTARGDVASTGTISAINPSNVRVGSNQPFGEYLNGSVDEVRFYRRLLTSEEVIADMNTAIPNSIVLNVTPANGATGVVVSAPVTVAFNLAMDAGTINSSTIELRNSSNVLVPSTVTYNSGTRIATLTPTAALNYASSYSIKVKGGGAGVKDATGSGMLVDYNGSFMTSDPPLIAMNDGPGGPVLVVSATANPFSRYAVEILRAEGLNHFAAADISTVTATLLDNYDVVVLGEMTVTAAQVTLLTNWVNAGGTLIAFKPSALLTPLMGISSASGTLADAYLLVNTASGPGAGIVNQTIQFHGTANRHTLSGATSLATLYSNATTATANPAVTSRQVGANGGVAVAFTYDLAKSIIYTRQGNPAWAGLERDGQSPIRSNDLFYPGWIDFSKVAIPQADEQQRLLANIILQSNLHRKPLPRFWYLPRDLKAAVVMTGDDHSNGGTTGRFNHYLTLGPNTPQDVANWNAVRGTSYIYPGTPITNTEAAAFEAQGFEIALHSSTNCANFTQTTLNSAMTTQLANLASQLPGISAPVSNRTHCMPWSDWATHAKVEASKGLRFDVNYYYWPGSWIQNRPGMFTGSGMPMRFADTDGSLIDCYQATTQMTDESEIGVGTFTNAVLDKALGAEGYYGVFTANMHTDTGANHVGSAAVITSALARQVPVISAKQMLTWLDGRNNSYFSNMVWNGNQLSFTVTARSNANNLKAMLPVNAETGQLISITFNGSPVTFTTQIIKGIDYAFFNTPAGINSYVATYSNLMTRVAAKGPASESTAPITAEEVQEPAVESEQLSVRVMPNPSNGYFNLAIRSSSSVPVSVRVVDVFGQISEKYDKISAGNIKIGSSLKPGIYFAEVIQGDQKKLVKIIRIN